MIVKKWRFLSFLACFSVIVCSSTNDSAKHEANTSNPSIPKATNPEFYTENAPTFLFENTYPYFYVYREDCKGHSDNTGTNSGLLDTTTDTVEKQNPHSPRIVIESSSLSITRRISHSCCQQTQLNGIVDMNTIVVYEFISGAPCRCYCWTDALLSFERLEPGIYTLSIIHYVFDSETHILYPSNTIYSDTLNIP